MPKNRKLIEDKLSLVIRSVCLTFFVAQKPNFRLSQQSCNFEKMWNGKRKYKVFFLSILSHSGVRIISEGAFLTFYAFTWLEYIHYTANKYDQITMEL